MAATKASMLLNNPEAGKNFSVRIQVVEQNLSVDNGSYDCLNFDEHSNKSYWNITCDAPVKFAVPLYGYGMPILILIALLVNYMIVQVLKQKSMQTPTNFVLKSMAICDILTAVCPIPYLIYAYTLGYHSAPLGPASLCVAFNIFHEILPTMFHTMSIWLTVALAVQRYIYVCVSPISHNWHSISQVRRTVFYIVLVAMLHQVTRCVDRTFSTINIMHRGIRAEVCHLDTSHWVLDYIGEDWYFTTYFAFRVLFVNLLPCIILVVLNLLLCRGLRVAQKRRKLLFRENRKKESKKLREINRTTLMLILVVAVFLIVELPFAIITLLHIVSSLFYEFLDYSVVNICIMLTNLFLVASYPINFAIYWGMSHQFREIFKQVIRDGCFKCKKWERHSRSNNNKVHYTPVNVPSSSTYETAV